MAGNDSDAQFFLGVRPGGVTVPGSRNFPCYYCGCQVAISPSGQKRMHWNATGRPCVMCLECAESRLEKDDGTRQEIEIGRDEEHVREMLAEIAMTRIMGNKN
jgi:hypothetical protein